MLRFRSTALLVLPLWFTLFWIAPLLANGQAADREPAQKSPSPASSSSQPSRTVQTDAPPAPAVEPIAIPANAPRISKQTRLEIIRDFETQLVYSRTTFPMNSKGLRLQGEIISPNGEDMRQALALWGPAIKPGDPARISLVQVKDDHIRFEINGGPIRHQKWYRHIEISGAQNTTVTPGKDEPQANPHGSFVDVYFGKYVPELTAQQVRALLFPVLDFNARNKEQAYLDAVPPKVKEAIQAHRVLVGMNREMVLHAKGKPPKKVRERDGETEYEEWIYGDAPADVDFVRIVDDEVVRVETIKIGGEKVVRTAKEVVLQPVDKDKDKDKDKEAKTEPDARPVSRPTLRRPGETLPEAPIPSDGTGVPLPRPAPGPDDPKAPPLSPENPPPGEFVRAR